MKTLNRSQRIMNGFKYSLIWIAILISKLAIMGTIYQTAATEADQGKYPPPGVLVNVNGYKMHIYCVGEGSPTIILDHVGGGSSQEWALIQPTLAKHTRVCAYDRAGFGRSDYNPAPRTLEQQAHELHGLLAGASEKGPYLYVGHSYGARVARVFAEKYPEEVDGMVLMDAGILYDDPRYSEQVLADYQNENKMILLSGRLAPFGLVRLLRPMLMSQPTYDLPTNARLADDSFAVTNRFWKSMKDQVDWDPVVFKEEHKVTTLGDIPLLVLISAERDPVTKQANIEMSELSTQGRYQIVEGATHMSLAYRQKDARVCTEGILSVLDTARTMAAR
jgi:pimeloyl-ACP methyl ester carboxylesterase